MKTSTAQAGEHHAQTSICRRSRQDPPACVARGLYYERTRNEGVSLEPVRCIYVDVCSPWRHRRLARCSPDPGAAQTPRSDDCRCSARRWDIDRRLCHKCRSDPRHQPTGPPLAVAGLSIGAAMVALAWRTREKVSPAPESAPLSVISVVALIVAFIATAVGIVLGYLGLRDTQNSTKRGRGLARAAVVIGWLGTVIWVIALSIGVWAALHQAGILHV